MKLQKICLHCKKAYCVPPARHASKFCSAVCRDTHGRTAERREIECETCKRQFIAVKHHGSWPRYCSRGCFLATTTPAQDKECANCGGFFLARSSSHQSADGLRKYCSKKCYSEAQRMGDERACVNCGTLFYVPPSRGKAKRTECCSADCRVAYYTGERSKGFRGGRYTDSSSGDTRVLMPREGYTSKYMQENRLVASQHIGRMVRRGEVVIRINRNPQDNRPENLFICESNSEFSKRRCGSLPWPTKSNLEDYAVPSKGSDS